MHYSHSDNPSTQDTLIPSPTRMLLIQIAQSRQFTVAEAKRIIRQIANHAIFSVQSPEYAQTILFRPSEKLMRSFVFHRTIEGQKYWMDVAAKLGERQ